MNGASPFSSRLVEASSEITRIAALPRRVWSDEAAAELAVMLTRELKTKAGTMALRPLQAIALYEAMETGGLFGPIHVGGGKCLGRGTPVLMFDGTIKSVEDVVVDDVLMGPDSGPRFVKSTCRGTETLYRIVPVKGTPYVVNESHVLSVKQTKMSHRDMPCMRGGRIRNLTVREFLGESEWFRDNWKGYRVGVEFPSKGTEVPEPYMLGLWLGDGSSNTFAITNADVEIVTEIRAFAARYNLQIRVSSQEGNAAYTYHLSNGPAAARKKKRNIAVAWLDFEGVLNNKHIPDVYKTGSRVERLEVLAGLLDSDGSLAHSGYDYISVSERLADDVCFVARSLGFAAYKRETRKECVNNGVWGTYYRVSISGDVSCIPCRVARKKAPVRRQKKSVLMTGIRAEPIGVGEYFGFELEGVDRLFLLGDFTVTHNTLLTLLLPSVLEAKRPILLLPAALVEKTWRDAQMLKEHWRLATNMQIVSYEMLGLVQSAQKLDYIEPDLIVADECHYLKNHRAGRTRRVVRYMAAHPTTKFVGVSGTVMRKSIRDFAHILRWCLKDKAPIPATEDETAAWADAVDETVNPIARRKLGALLNLGPATEGESDLVRARRVFQSRLLDTAGVVASAKTDGVTCSLRVSALEYEAAPITSEHFTHVRKTKTTPDGWAFAEPMLLRMYLRQLALGFHGIWQPRPPEAWINARREWASFVRDALDESSVLDTELQVANAVDAGVLRTPALDAWRAVRDSFQVQPTDVWHDDSAIQACAAWAEREKGIVWCEHRFFARRLAQVAGLTYYGANGLSDAGESITLVKPGKAIVASVQANATGRNLQCFSTNLITSCPPSAQTVEQLIGRTHREGQLADEVEVWILLGCREHADSFERALESARAAADTLGHQQKLLLSDVLMPDVSSRRGSLWQ